MHSGYVYFMQMMHHADLCVCFYVFSILYVWVYFQMLQQICIGANDARDGLNNKISSVRWNV